MTSKRNPLKIRNETAQPLRLDITDRQFHVQTSSMMTDATTMPVGALLTSHVDDGEEVVLLPGGLTIRAGGE